ncbi:ribosomal protein S5 alanine N-acetyltransferase [Salinivibrio sp. AR647]|uniref:GNAT family N-acetyltransferase n=1 Tax=Salinivibrio sp. AR647 TaxID=1909438 RepID=UPI0009867D92|nr:GNAT family N-acetyltransferase [Salinivibrio sp. AR647]OOE93854.1 ribosomal protein S5 alanine N-acetyltransferase [Salinivibrio sp. AR647]
MYEPSVSDLPRLSVDELRIDAISHEDVMRVVQYFQRNRAFLTPWEPARTSGFYSEQGWKRRVLQLMELQKHQLAYYFLIATQDSPTVLGVISYTSMMQYPSYSCTVGYSLDQAAQGQGIMRRALATTNQWLFDNIHIHRVNAAYMPCNARSAKVLEAVGFEREGRARDYLLINGQWEDHLLMAHINPHWRPKSSS